MSMSSYRQSCSGESHGNAIQHIREADASDSATGCHIHCARRLSPGVGTGPRPTAKPCDWLTAGFRGKIQNQELGEKQQSETDNTIRTEIQVNLQLDRCKTLFMRFAEMTGSLQPNV
jgi:hypothetical protein